MGALIAQRCRQPPAGEILLDQALAAERQTQARGRGLQRQHGVAQPLAGLAWQVGSAGMGAPARPVGAAAVRLGGRIVEERETADRRRSRPAARVRAEGPGEQTGRTASPIRNSTASPG